MKKKTRVNFSRVKLLVEGKIGHFSLTKFYIPQVGQKALIFPLKSYFKNRKLINCQVNWFIKINVNGEVFFFFFTTTVSVTDQFWLISRRKFPFFNYPSLPNSTQPDYGITNLIVFLRFPIFGFYSGEKITDNNFWSELILVR